MKKLILVLCIGFCSIPLLAQQSTFMKGDQVAGLAIGIGGNLHSGLGYGSGMTRIPAVSGLYEYCIMDNLWDEKSSLGVGGVLGFAYAKWNAREYGYGWKCTNFIIGARGSLHYALVDKLDTYTSLMLGANVVSWKWTGDYDAHGRKGSAGSGLALMWNVGARYYFTDNFAAFGELGYGFAILNLGVCMKF